MKYFGNWKETGYEGMKQDFEPTVSVELPAPKDILFAGYWYGSYSGSARVLYRKGDKLFEVEAGHCSCNGLEGQFAHGGEVTPESLAMRPELDESDADEESRTAWKRLVGRLQGVRA